MTLLQIAEVYGAYFILAFIFAFAVLVAWINTTGDIPPLLDGTRFGSVLDDHDRGHIVDRALAEDREVEWLDGIWALPAREPKL